LTVTSASQFEAILGSSFARVRLITVACGSAAVMEVINSAASFVIANTFTKVFGRDFSLLGQGSQRTVGRIEVCS
jgi:hypothetical protein